jgi:hypothetical protein
MASKAWDVVLKVDSEVVTVYSFWDLKTGPEHHNGARIEMNRIFLRPPVWDTPTRTP